MDQLNPNVNQFKDELNKPLTIGEMNKVIIFFLLILITTPIILPVLILLFGLIMMKRNHSFEVLEASVRAYKIILMLAVFVCVIFSVSLGLAYYKDFHNPPISDSKIEALVKSKQTELRKFYKNKDAPCYLSSEYCNKSRDKNEHELKLEELQIVGSLDHERSMLEQEQHIRKQSIKNSQYLFICSLIWLSISMFYLKIVNPLFLRPLKNHSEWVVHNGIFSSKK